MAEEASTDPRVGEVLEGRYRILERLASGGMGVVYRGERMQLGRAVAIKFLDGANATDDNSRARFEREAKAMSRLSHPHCVSVIDFGVSGDGNTPYIVMDYVTGQPLISVIANSRLKAHRVVHIMKQVMAGLAHAHNQHVIHRDIKPANIMLTEATGTGDFVRILDFGLAKLRGATSLSSANVVIGTPSYMSPEQGSGKPIDGRTDIYSSGVILYELLMGEKPFVGEDAFATLRMHQSEKVPALGDIRGSDELRTAVNKVIQKAMAKKPSARYQTALEMGQDLARIEEAHRPPLKLPGGKLLAKIDPARARTELPTAAAPVSDATPDAAPDATPDATPDADQTSVLSEASKSYQKEPSGSSGGAFRFLLTIALFTAVGGAGWYYWQQRASNKGSVAQVGRDAGFNATRPRADAAGQRVFAADAAAMSLDAAAIVDASQSDVVTDLGALGDPDASDEPIEPEVDAGALSVGGGDAGALGPAPLPKVIARYSDVEAFLAAGKRAEAMAGLNKLVRADPKNGFYHLKLGHLYFEQGAWSAGLAAYRAAVRYRAKYRSYATVNRNAIHALGAPKTRWAAQSLIINGLGRAALPFLRRAAGGDKSATIRKRASYIIKKIR